MRAYKAEVAYSYDMIRCKTCGTSYNETLAYCPVCGTRNPSYLPLKKGVLSIDKFSLVGKDLEQIKKMPIRKVTTVVSFHIPFLLHLVDGNYEMKEDNQWIVFQLTRVNEPPEHTRKLFGGIKMQFPPNPEIPKDRLGRLAHTHVSVFIPYKIMDDPNTFSFECPKCGIEISSTSRTCSLCGAKFTQDEAKKSAHSVIKRTAISLFNKFLEAYRFYSREYHIEPIKNPDIVSFECNYMRRGKKYIGYRYLFDILIESGDAFILDDSVHEELRDFLKNGKQIEIEERLLCNSKNHLTTEEHPIALLEAVSALEIVLSAFIRKESSNAGIGKKAVEKFIRNVGVSGHVKVILKLLTKAEEQLPNHIYSSCEGAITLRNKVVHKGLLKLDPADVKRRIVSIEIMIRYVQSIKQKHAKTS